MAAMLAEIKSRMLLPRASELEDEEEDPARAADPAPAGVRALQESGGGYRGLAACGAAIPGWAAPIAPELHRARPDPDVDMREFCWPWARCCAARTCSPATISSARRLSTRERMSEVLERLAGRQFVPFVSLFPRVRGTARRRGHLPGAHGAHQGITGGNRADREFWSRSTSRQGRSICRRSVWCRLSRARCWPRAGR